MAWQLEVSPHFERDYRKLCKKDAVLRKAVDNKVAQILEQPLHYKPLRGPLKGVRRVHVASSFVLLFEPNEPTGTVRLLRLAHHDEVYET
ncbi:MAG TPA: type II toxin-antitoxin system RelE/ParE family toxin [Candidatus Thermoplasmatota archaeon]|jgi:YafQ family addiction module toxin component|nr:type II toxin-antitoxin system RelE/ParE family toxin [Candidatus Thermoplasmatota archaeon]